MIDLRSDTITRPTQGMLEAMTNAAVGDDVFGEDPTVNAFQKKVAELFGKEAGLFVSSGTMGNQLGIKVHTEPGDEVLIDEKGHVFNYETGAASFLSGVQLNPLKGERGKLSVDVLKNRVRGLYEWEPRTKVICIENTTNKGGGVCYTEQELNGISEFATDHELIIHLDGARIWNAITASGVKPKFFGEIAETISVCFSKGLGAPVGSMLLGPEEKIRKARRLRKMMGGGMRQIGLLAAAADYALEKHWPLLEEDHRRAKAFAQTVSECSQLSIDLDSVETNIVIFDVKEGGAPAALAKLADQGIHMVQFGADTIRATFHFQVGDAELEKVIKTIKSLFR